MSTKKTKVLFLIHTLQIGGAERVLVDLVNRLDKNKFDITVMTVVNVGVLKSELNLGVRYRTIFDFKFLKKLGGGEKKYAESINPSAKKNLFKEAFIKTYTNFWKRVDLKKFYKKHISEKYDVEVAFLEGIPAKIIANSTNPYSKKLCWIHVDLKNEPKSDRFFDNLAEQQKTYDRFNQIICVSKVVRSSFLEKIGAIEEKVKVIYNPIDKNAVLKQSEKEIGENDSLSPASARVYTASPKAPFTFCSVGRLSKQKGYDRLIRVAKKLEENGYSFKIDIIGVGPEEANLIKQIEELNVNSVALLGYRKNPYPHIKNADVFICSSRAEGFSTATAEAIILKKAIISTKCSGVEEMLGENSDYGLICENNEVGLFDAMKNILDQPELKSHYEEKVAERTVIFNIDQTISKIEEVLGYEK